MPLDIEVSQHFAALWGDIKLQDAFPNKRPMVAHYSDLERIESIIKHQTLWFSHPLFMNDLEELKFGISEAHAAFFAHEGIERACKTPERYAKLRHYYDFINSRFAENDAFDIYVFCLSEYDDVLHRDGLLSMWRGYGADGGGAAIVFDTTKLVANEDSPLIVARVDYKSGEERRQWIKDRLNQFAALLESLEIDDDQLHLAAHNLFQRILIFALFTKHNGFLEEREWRVVYLRSRDQLNMLSHMLDYHITPTGIQPKLKLNLGDKALPELEDGLDGLVHKIILGPSVSSPMHVAAVKRMFERLQKPGLASKIFTSTTPYRRTRN